MFWILVIAILLGAFLGLVIEACFGAEEYTDEEIVTAIWHSEGGEKAKKPFGILSVPCEGYDSCRQICLNTVRNNRKRYAKQSKYNDFIEFLGSRYAPTENCPNDPKGLNSNWIRNVLYFLRKESEK